MGSFSAFDVDFFGVEAENSVGRDLKLRVDSFEEFDYVTEELLADALAGGVDGEFEFGAREDHGSSKHGH